MKTTMSKEEVEREMMRFQLIQDFTQIDEQTREARVDRYLEIDRQRIIGNYHFSRASTECIHLYRDGHFISTVMTTQAVNGSSLKTLRLSLKPVIRHHKRQPNALLTLNSSLGG